MLAYAQTVGGGEAGQSMISLIILLVVFAAIFYFLLIRPQRRRQKEHQQLISSLKRGDRVITAGGIYGTIDKIDEGTVILSLEEGAKIRVSKSSIVEKVKK
jgi:preprotein translocase subunit YajC